jgi:hypothetical protein
MMHTALLRSRSLPLRFAASGLALLVLAHCGEQGRASRFEDPQLQPRLPPNVELDAAAPDDEELDAGAAPAPDSAEDAGDEFVKYWDGSTTPTSDYVRHDAGDTPPRGSDAVGDASAP